ncbi:MAG: SDR family NAD(P)-dependent oxidoreductase [Candidatus Aenigmatarchaeota archaeon]
MKLLITGGAGFIGSNLAKYLFSKGYEIVIYDNLSRNNTKHNLEWLKKSCGDEINFVNGDVRNFKILQEKVIDVDIIIHTAAQVAVTSSFKNPREDFEINVLGTLNILEAARQSDKRPAIIYFSTNKVYGDNVNKIPLIEKQTRYEFADEKYKFGISENFPTDTNNHTPYGVSKYAAELYVREYGLTYDLPSVVLRCSCIYGPRQFGNEDQGWITHFTISSIFDKLITIYGNGKQVRDILYIDDLVKLVEMLMKKIEKFRGEVFNVGGGPGNTISLLELIKLLEDTLNKKIKLSFSNWRPADQKVYISDIRKAEKLIRWKPSIKPRDGVNKLISWVDGNKTLFI